MSPTDERRASIDFSDVYYVSDLVMVVRKDGPYAQATSLEEFEGAKITAQLNTFHYTVVDQIAGVDKQTAMEDFPTMIVALQSGKIDGYVSEPVSYTHLDVYKRQVLAGTVCYVFLITI